MFKKSHDGFGLETLWPPNSADEEGAIVDIIFVHGLGGSRHATWKQNNVLWPQVLLSQDFPKARIMTWGYDADIMHFFGPVGQGNVQDHAKTLNFDVSQQRVEDHQILRPIIFVAHNLGGLIVKDTLFLSYLEGVKEAPAFGDEGVAAIKRSTKGILFAGTPHRGVDKAKWAMTATKLARFIQKDHSTQLLRSLERGSEVLERMQYSFKDILQSFAIYTLLEELGYPKVGKIVEKDSAVIGWHEKEIMIHANHGDMVKFSNQNDNNYKKIRNIIREIIRNRVVREGRRVGNTSPSPRRSTSSFRPNISTPPKPSSRSSLGRQELLTFRRSIKPTGSRVAAVSEQFGEVAKSQAATTSDHCATPISTSRTPPKRNGSPASRI